MSIHPEFVRLILNGKKKVEFRKIRFSIDVSHVVIYATLPIKKIVGYFEVKNINTGSPDELWSSYRNIGGIEEERFYEYYKNYSNGIAIEIGEVYKLDNYLPLSYISSSAPPQSYSYINRKTFEQIVGMIHRKTESTLRR